MSDPLDRRLRDFAMDLPATAPPAGPADVRRRGDRLRRRRTALTAAGAALAVAVVVTPVAVLAGDGSQQVQPPPATSTPTDAPTDPPPSPSPPAPPAGGAVVDRVPEGFPITASYPTENLDGSPVLVTDAPGLPSIEVCGTAAWAAPAEALDVVGAAYDGGEDFRRRTLALYPTTDAAAAALQSLRDAVAACPTEGDGSAGSVWAEDVRISTDDAVAVTRAYTTGGQPVPGLEVYWLVREGNALLVDSASGEGGTTPGSIRSFVDLVVEDAGPLLEAIESLGGGSAGAPRLLSPRFLPPADELPARARLSSWEADVAGDEVLVGCQPDGGLDSLAASEVITRSYAATPADGLPGDAQLRISVLQFSSDAAAEAAEATVTGWIRDCGDPAGTELDRATPLGGLVETEQTGVYGTWTYAKPCEGGCDSAWFERMSVLADLGRMVVVSFREAGGPQEPAGLDAYMEALMLRAAGGSMPG